jgi:hypothetical protein
MDAILLAETSVITYSITRHHSTEDHSLHKLPTSSTYVVFKVISTNPSTWMRKFERNKKVHFKMSLFLLYQT